MTGPIRAAQAQHGAAKLAAIGVKLKAEGNGLMRRRVAGALRAQARPMADKTAEAARRRLPKADGLNELVARRRVTISVLMGPQTAGVRLRKRKDAASYQTNLGYISHPIPAGARGDIDRTDPRYWVKPPQRLPNAAGWWSDTLVREGIATTPALLAVINVMAREIGA